MAGKKGFIFMKKSLIHVLEIFLIIVVVAVSAPHAMGQEAAAPNPATTALKKSGPMEIAVDGEQATDESRRNLRNEYARVELAYMRVVKYYNSNLTDGQALEISRHILLYSAKFKLDPRLVVAVIAVESRFQPRAVSPKGAQGLGQLMPGTARMLGVRNAFDVKQNIYGTTRYIWMQSNRWRNSDRTLDLALASYNAGPEAVEKHKGIPPYRETREYVRKVTSLYRYFVYGS